MANESKDDWTWGAKLAVAGGLIAGYLPGHLLVKAALTPTAAKVLAVSPCFGTSCLHDENCN
jgi:hypothetical protein